MHADGQVRPSSSASQCPGRGRRVKGAFGVVLVITLATGQMRQWTSPPPAATPVLGGPGAWTSDGRTLALGQMSIQPGGRIRADPTQMRLLNTTAPGINLAAASKLVILHGAGSFPWPSSPPTAPS